MANVTVYDLTVPQFIMQLEALKGVLKKAQAWAEPKKVDMSVLFGMRLVPDQFPLSRQIQIACDGAKFCVTRLTGKEAPKFEDNETTVDQFMARIDKTVAFLKTTKPEDFNGFESKVISFPWYPGHHMKGKDYLISHALPNFFFHVTTAYAILRENGIDLGKADFLGKQNWIKD